MNDMARPHGQEEDVFGRDLCLMHELIVTGRKAGADRTFWAKLAHDEELLEQVVGFAKNPEKFVDASSRAQEILDPDKVMSASHAFKVWGSKPVSLKLARQIMGRDKVISAHVASTAWGKKADSRFPIRYSEQTLRKCAEENARGGADWRLLFGNGLSLREQHEIQGVASADGENQPCFCKDNFFWWLSSQENGWAKTSPEAGYRLIDVKGRFANKTWSQQTTLIAELGEQHERCDEHVFAEVIQTIFIVKNGERIAESWMHWGCSTSSSGRKVIVGNFLRDGLPVDGYWREHHYFSVRVVVSRKFDF